VHEGEAGTAESERHDVLKHGLLPSVHSLGRRKHKRPMPLQCPIAPMPFPHAALFPRPREQAPHSLLKDGVGHVLVEAVAATEAAAWAARSPRRHPAL